MSSILSTLHERHIRDTNKEAIVTDVRVFLCHLTNQVCKNAIGIDQIRTRVYIRTRVLKHCYDKRNAQEYDCLIQNGHVVTRFPDHVYKNKPSKSKRGDFCLVKTINNRKYLFCIEEVKDGEFKAFEVVTFYAVPKEKYLESYELLWSWKDDNTPSS